MKIQKLSDPSFKQYGRVITGYDLSDLVKEVQHTARPLDDVIYVASSQDLENMPAAAYLRDDVYGGLPVQIGYCNGNNRKLNALEYHRCSEVDIAADDLILLLGRQQDIGEDFHYDTAKVEAFFVPAGTAVELYATSLHYAPCSAGPEGFRCIIVLPKDTNLDLEAEPIREDEGKLLAARNKWLIAHEEAGIGGAFNGLDGANIDLDRD